ncbi:hypothetical protein LINPERHAP2_LOCUS38317 [Linum perenne]
MILMCAGMEFLMIDFRSQQPGILFVPLGRRFLGIS